MASHGSQERPQKILVAMHDLSGGTTKPLKYEDIVVKAFRMFPDDFALRGYPEYPDSSDIHKPLYGPLKRDGFIRSGNKKFGLTARGVEAAGKLVAIAGKKLAEERDGLRMTRDVKDEVDRMLASAALRLFENGEVDRVLDTDFYAFLGCTVRTPRNDFLGRVSACAEAVAMAKKLKQPTPEAAKALADVMAFLNRKFADLVGPSRSKAEGAK